MKRSTKLTLGLSICFSILGVSLVLPLFNKRSGWDILFGDNEIVDIRNIGDEPFIPEPYFYENFTPPINSFGSSGGIIKIVNDSYWWGFFENNTSWKLEYSKLGDTWDDVTESGLDIGIIKDNIELSEKMILNFSAENTGYYRLNFTINQSCSSYYFDGVSEYSVNVSIPNTSEGYNASFNWSDVIDSSWNEYIIYNHGFVDDKFFFSVNITSKISKGNSVSIDPVFGYNKIAATPTACGNYIRGTLHTMGSTDGQIYYGHAYLRASWGFSPWPYATMLVYDSDDNLVAASSSNVELTGGAVPGWYNFSFDDENLTALEDYYICVWGSNEGGSPVQHQTLIFYDTSTSNNSYEDSETYNFGSEPDPWSPSLWGSGYSISAFIVYNEVASPTTFTINFSGNHGDTGGPYYIPMLENTSTGGPYVENGYFTSDSKQNETYVNISMTTTLSGSSISSVNLCWYNDTTDTWDNDSSYLFNKRGDYFWFNTSDNITITPNHRYTFRINVTETDSSYHIVNWTKRYNATVNVTRYVTLGCTTENMSYIPFYMRDYPTGEDPMPTFLGYDTSYFDHCFGADASPSSDDTGGMYYYIPDDAVSDNFCTIWAGFFMNSSNCSQTDTITSFCYHIWASATFGDPNTLRIGLTKERAKNTYTGEDGTGNNVTVNISSDGKSSIYYDAYGPSGNNTFNLYTGKVVLDTPLNISDNSFYELLFLVEDARTGGGSDNPHVICNRSFISCIWLNPDSNATMQGQDTDSDGINDFYEMFTLGTSPNLVDTDNDGVSDWWENRTGSDPNNYTDTTSPSFKQNWYSNFSFSNTSILIQEWYSNFSFSNTSTHKQEWYSNFSFSNTATHTQNWYSNFSFSNTSNFVQQWYSNFSFSNISNYQQNWYSNFSFSNTTQLIQQWYSNFSFSNTSIRYWYQNWMSNFSFSNTSNFVQNWYSNFSFSNTVYLVQEWYSNFSFSNTSNLIQVWYSNLSFSNTSNFIQHWYSNFSFSNTSNYLQEWFSNFSFSNTSIYEQVWYSNFSFSNTTVKAWIQNWYSNFSFRNSSLVLVQQWYSNFSFSNTSVTYIIISDIYPSNNSINNPLQPYLYATFNSTLGWIMNITWYYGLTQGNENILLGSDVNITNSTQNELFFQAVGNVTIYYWRIWANDGIHHVNETFIFTTQGFGFGGRSSIGIVGVIGIFGILGFIFVLIRRRRNNNE